MEFRFFSTVICVSKEFVGNNSLMFFSPVLCIIFQKVTNKRWWLAHNESNLCLEMEVLKIAFF